MVRPMLPFFTKPHAMCGHGRVQGAPPIPFQGPGATSLTAQAPNTLFTLLLLDPETRPDNNTLALRDGGVATGFRDAVTSHETVGGCGISSSPHACGGQHPGSAGMGTLHPTREGGRPSDQLRDPRAVVSGEEQLSVQHCSQGLHEHLMGGRSAAIPSLLPGLERTGQSTACLTYRNRCIK